MAKKCNECGHVGSEFLQPATVDCLAIVNEAGEFEWWHMENFENPNFESDVFLCRKCTSEDLIDIEEEE